MSVATDSAALVQAPIASADSSGLTGVARIAITGTAQSITVPAALRGRWIDLYVTADIQYGFSVDGSKVLAKDQIAPLGTGHAAAGKTLVAGTDKPTRVPNSATHLNFIGTTGYLEIYCSEALGV